MAYRVLFLCTHNSARSQMAEGLTNELCRGSIEAASAGTDPGTLHPLAIRVMSEIGVDISKNASKHMSVFEGERFDLVITVCDGAREICPFFPEAKRQEHAGFPDPTAETGREEERLEAFRRVRDDIACYIRERFGLMSSEARRK